MKILYFYQFFSTPNGSWGTRVYEFSKNWIEQGHEVTVVTNLFAKSDLTAKKFLETQIHDGIKVKIINITLDNKQSKLRRVIGFLTYSIISIWYALTIKADVVVASSGPITVGIPGLIAKYFRGRKLVFEVRDLWPQGAIELGILKNKWLIKLSYFFEKICYKASSHIIVLSPGMKDDLNERYGIKKITSVTNSANLTLFGTESHFDSKELAGQFYVLYNGNIGETNNSMWLLETARLLKQKNVTDIFIVMIGDGQLKSEIKAAKTREGLHQLILLDLMPKYRLVSFIQNAAFSLVPLKGTPILDTSSPNKFFESLAAGTPIIQNTRGWMKDYLEENLVGFTVDPNSPEDLANLLITLKNLELSEYRSRCRKCAKDFDKDYLSNKMLNALIEA